MIHDSEQEPQYVPQTILKDYSSCDIAMDEPDVDLVMKYSWVPKRSANVEGKLFNDCGGKFGVADHYFSYMVAHKPDVIVNNHLFLPKGAKAMDSSDDIRDYRTLWAHALKFAGESLLSVETPRILITSIVHAILGDYHGYSIMDVC
jgi:hypothetical protein